MFPSRRSRPLPLAFPLKVFPSTLPKSEQNILFTLSLKEASWLSHSLFSALSVGLLHSSQRIAAGGCFRWYNVHKNLLTLPFEIT